MPRGSAWDRNSKEFPTTWTGPGRKYKELFANTAKMAEIRHLSTVVSIVSDGSVTYSSGLIALVRIPAALDATISTDVGDDSEYTVHRVAWALAGADKMVIARLNWRQIKVDSEDELGVLILTLSHGAAFTVRAQMQATWMQRTHTV